MRQSQNIPQAVALAFATEKPLIYVIGEEDQIRQIVINIIGNALDAVDPEDGKVTVKVESPAPDGRFSTTDWVQLTISDNGIGLNSEVREKLFEPFFSRKKGGTGLGLAIVKRCLDNIKGQISVESAPGAGAKFRIYLRRYIQTREEESAKSPASAEMKSPVA